MRRENRNTRRKASWFKDENQQQTQPTYDAESGNRNWATLMGSKCPHHCTLLSHFFTKHSLLLHKLGCIANILIYRALHNRYSVEITSRLQRNNKKVMWNGHVPIVIPLSILFQIGKISFLQGKMSYASLAVLVQVLYANVFSITVVPKCNASEPTLNSIFLVARNIKFYVSDREQCTAISINVVGSKLKA